MTSFSFAHWEVLIPNYSRGTSLGEVFLNARFLFCCSRLWICHSVLSWPVKLLLRSLSWMSMLLSGFDAFCLISRILFCVCVCVWCFAVITQRGTLLVESIRDPLSLPGPFPWEVSSLFGKFSSYSIGFFFFSMPFFFSSGTPVIWIFACWCLSHIYQRLCWVLSFRFIYLKSGVTERGIGRVCFLIHSSKFINGEGLARPKPRAQNLIWICQMARMQALGCSFTAFWSTLAGRTWTSGLRSWHGRQWLNLLCYKAGFSLFF